VTLCAGDRSDARAHLEAAAKVFGGIETTHQEGWALALLAAICAEGGNAATGRRWLERASRHFELLGAHDARPAVIARCADSSDVRHAIGFARSRTVTTRPTCSV
jgi:hypothetical protein